MKFSALGSVYAKENPKFLDAALESLHKQTLPADEIILVNDGFLTREIYAILAKWEKSLPLINIPLKEKAGLSKALNVGLKRCSQDLVARFDADDINIQERFKIQIKYFANHQNISILSSGIHEFLKVPGDTDTYRRLPLAHDSIIHYARSRNPINHPAAMFKRKDALSVGGYPENVPFMEDYALWLNMIAKGYRFHNLSDVLVNHRSGKEFIKRRSGYSYAKSEITIYTEKKNLKIASGINDFIIFSTRFISRLMPAFLLSIIYKRLRRA